MDVLEYCVLFSINWKNINHLGFAAYSFVWGTLIIGAYYFSRCMMIDPDNKSVACDFRCTINPGENEALVQYALDKYEFLSLAAQVGLLKLTFRMEKLHRI